MARVGRRGRSRHDGRTGHSRRIEAPFVRRVRDRRRRHHRSRGVLVLSVLALMGLLLAGTWVVLGSSLLAVDQVVVEGTHRLSAAAVRQAAAVPMGEPLLTLDRDAIAERVRALPPVADVDVARRWPATVALVVAERTPAAALVEGTRVWLVDREGVAFATVAKRPQGMPLVTGMRTSDVDRLSAAVTVVSGLPRDLAALVRSASAASTDAVVLHLTHERTVIWGAAAEPAAKAAVLRVLLKTATATTYDVSAPRAPTTRR